mmetsp:Transcript_12747/g.54530  ORF Transcript_12747/g.54530 Transcript_12747/m.54530 type:complete len:234 (-) Transcript_12747:2056-2757(-)
MPEEVQERKAEPRGDAVPARDGGGGGLRPSVLRLAAGMGGRRVPDSRGRPGTRPPPRLRPQPADADRARAVRQHGARPPDRGDPQRLHTRVPLLPAGYAHQAGAGRRPGGGGGSRGARDARHGIQRVLAVVAVVLGLPRAPQRRAGDQEQAEGRERHPVVAVATHRPLRRLRGEHPRRRREGWLDVCPRGGDAAPPGHRQQGLDERRAAARRADGVRPGVEKREAVFHDRLAG